MSLTFLFILAANVCNINHLSIYSYYKCLQCNRIILFFSLRLLSKFSRTFSLTVMNANNETIQHNVKKDIEKLQISSVNIHCFFLCFYRNIMKNGLIQV